MVAYRYFEFGLETPCLPRVAMEWLLAGLIGTGGGW